MSERGIRVPLAAFASAAALAIISMLLYPGGTPLDHTTHGYTPLQNFLSDLGMTVAYNGAPNLPGACLFAVAIVLNMAGAASALRPLARACWRSPSSRVFVVCAGMVAVVTALAFAGVALSPENSQWSRHLDFTFLGFALAPVVMMMMSFAVRASGNAPRNVLYTCIALTAALSAYTCFQHWGPTVSTREGLLMQVAAQKAVVLLGGLACLRVAYATRAM